MTSLNLWNRGHRGKDFNFLDRAVSEWFGISGTTMYVHKYLGVHDQIGDGTGSGEVTEVQDLLYLENRDRKYDPKVYELRCVYDVDENDIDLKQFGAFFTGDTLYIYVHLNDMFNMIGRRVMSGDVIELPHQRDDNLLDPAAPAINKFYVVQDATKASEGFQQNWFPLVWRLKCGPMTASQEFADILDSRTENVFGEETGKLSDLITVIHADLDINTTVVESAKASVHRRYFETRQFYVMPGDETLRQDPWIFAGDGIPPNGAVSLGSGTRFPEQRVEGDYYLRTDYFPHALFRFVSGLWRQQEQDYRQGDWSPASRILGDFINNDTIAKLADGTTTPEKQSLYKAIKPQADL